MTVNELIDYLSSLPGDLHIVAHDPGDPSVGIFSATYDVVSCYWAQDVDDEGELTNEQFVTLGLST